MLTRAAVLLATLAVAGCVAASAPAATPLRTCPAHPVKVFGRAKYARLIVAHQNIVTCYGTHGPVHRIDDYFDSDFAYLTITHVRFAGRYVAYEQDNHGKGEVEYLVQVYDMKTGKRRTIMSTSGYSGAGFDGGPATQVKLTANGLVASIAAYSNPQTGVLEPPYWVSSASSSSHRRQIASGSSISPTFLTLTRHGQVCWKGPAITCGSI